MDGERSRRENSIIPVFTFLLLFRAIFLMNCARTLIKNTSKTVSRLYRRNFSETAVRKNIWIEEHNGIKEDLTNRFEWTGANIVNSIIFLGLIPGFIYLAGKKAQYVGIGRVG